MGCEAVSLSCGQGIVVGAYELDGDKSHKELVVLNVGCEQEKERLIGSDTFYTSNLEIWHYNPETGKHDIKRVVHSLPASEAYALELGRGRGTTDPGNMGSVDDYLAVTLADAVTVADMNDDGRLDLVVKTTGKNELVKYSAGQAEQEVTVLYNDGKGNFTSEVKCPSWMELAFPKSGE